MKTLDLTKRDYINSINKVLKNNLKQEIYRNIQKRIKLIMN